MRLKNIKIIVGITGSIAAYKAAILLRLLIKEGAEVQVVITPSGKEFITPLTLSAISGKPVVSEFFSSKDGTWHSHVDLGLWADVMIIAPATASTIGKMACGIADNMLITTYLSAKCPVFIAPAMDIDMYRHSSTVKNINTLKEYGNIIIEPGEGELASGLTGKGRLQEPESIVNIVADYLSRKKKLLNKKFLVSAGPTYEMIDPVRFIGNCSSGKMGFAVAEELAFCGAEVVLITGPVQISASSPNIKTVKIESAEEMYNECLRYFPECDGAVMAAAVSDFTPVNVESQKTKRTENEIVISFKPTADIAAKLGKIKREGQLLVGFALESSNEIENAKSKLTKKNFDFIVLNSLNDPGAGFNFDTNKITIIGNDNKTHFFELKSKREAAADIVEKIYSLIR
ncbi:MAG: bifunctional phosphopantothenoylcysteine decarboxylase/phosphopantothenate--cysteine ligase CoaBC [Bacteroidales bacterium]|nr:bifunctional phosphopantothenoylcysteine decarboxylase/phosphopantothenate--cysteine ligase CoaBC [Bacteroidales bacterium]